MNLAIEQSLDNFTNPFNSMLGGGLIASVILPVFAGMALYRSFKTGFAEWMFYGLLLTISGVVLGGNCVQAVFRNQERADLVQRIMAEPEWDVIEAVMEGGEVVKLVLAAPTRFMDIEVLGKTAWARVPGESVTLDGPLLQNLISTPELTAAVGRKAHLAGNP